jgi:hypothetical protein
MLPDRYLIPLVIPLPDSNGFNHHYETKRILNPYELFSSTELAGI